MANPPIWRTSMALIEKVSPFPTTPPDRYKYESQMVHQISPNPRNERFLRNEGEGIKRKLSSFKGEEACKLKDDPILRSVVMRAYHDVKENLSKDMREILVEVKEFRNWKQSMENQIMLRSLVKEWTGLENGKRMSRDLVSPINKNYTKLVKNGVPHRKCKENNLYREVKSLLKMIEYGEEEETCHKYMAALEETIQEHTHLPGQELVDLLNVYLNCNEVVHINWDLEKLKQAVQKARNGEFSFGERKLTHWVLQMVRELSRRSGFGDLGITDEEITTGFDFAAV